MILVPLHSRFEAAFESALAYRNPVQDVRLIVQFSNGSHRFQADAFWDGDKCWRVRFSPSIAGEWLWRTECSQMDDVGLHGRQGQFECAAAISPNEWLINGPLSMAQFQSSVAALAFPHHAKAVHTPNGYALIVLKNPVV